MAYRFSHIPVEETGYFSRLVTDYLQQKGPIQQFYKYAPDMGGLKQAIADRAKYPVNRQALTDALNRQYATLEKHAKAEENIARLANEHTYTVCTAHQPNLMTGYLYFVYKILHTVKLANELNTAHPGKHFVPVYYMGSEDNDLDELGVFRLRGEKYKWDGAGQTGAVGRMATASLKPLLAEVFRLFGPPGKDTEHLQKIITEAYLKHKTIGAATQYLVNELFGQYGVVVIDPDDAALKTAYIPVMEDELLHQATYPLLKQQADALAADYKVQAYPREINLFYLDTQLRERIEKQDDKWVVLNTDISFTEEELLRELNLHPEKFSPNVMLRGLFQEMILPNVTFIGGGAEVAYWMQLKPVFEHYNGFFPCIILRQSAMVMNKQHQKLAADLGYSIGELFKKEDVLVNEYVTTHASTDWKTEGEALAMAALMEQLKQKATIVDSTLAQAAGAALKKIQYQLDILEKKMFRAEKRRQEVQIDRIWRIKSALFPGGGLQERVDNFAEYYMELGPALFDAIIEGTHPTGRAFLVILHDA